MSLLSVFDIAGTGMTAQSLRLNVTASNLANAQNVAGSPEELYRARHPIFRAQPLDFNTELSAVRVMGVMESRAEANQRYQPGHPAADEAGMVYSSNVNAVEEMANMISASRSYQGNLEIVNTSKELLIRTLSLGQ